MPWYLISRNCFPFTNFFLFILSHIENFVFKFINLRLLEYLFEVPFSEVHLVNRLCDSIRFVVLADLFILLINILGSSIVTDLALIDHGNE